MYACSHHERVREGESDPSQEDRGELMSDDYLASINTIDSAVALT